MVNNALICYNYLKQVMLKVGEFQVEFSERIKSVKPSAIREILKLSSDPSVISFAAGNPSEKAFPTQLIKNIIDDIFKENPIGALQYSVSEGFLPLREKIAKMVNAKGIVAGEKNIIVTSGAQQAIEMITKIFINEGETVLCEEPSFVGALNAFRTYGAKLKGVETDEEGILPSKLEEAIKESKNPKLLYIIPNFQNPTGITTSQKRREEILKICLENDIIIIEDDPYGDLRFKGEDIKPIKSLPNSKNVIYVGSFSKILSPGLRVGYAVTTEEILKKLTVAKQCSDVHSNIMAQMICNEFLERVDLNSHLEFLRNLYRQKAELMLGEIKNSFSNKVKVFEPKGGLFIWAKLSQGEDGAYFASKLVSENKIAVVPGSAFLTNDSEKENGFRLNFSKPTDDEIIKGIRKMGELTKKLYD